MRLVTGSLSAAALATFLVVMHPETPWLGPKTDDLFSVASSAITLSPGQSLVVATVPPGKRLVITDASLSDQTIWFSLDIDLNQVDATGAATVKIPRGFLTNQFAYVRNPVAHGNGQGVVFDAGTNVVLTLSPGAPQADTFSYLIAGYYAPK